MIKRVPKNGPTLKNRLIRVGLFLLVAVAGGGLIERPVEELLGAAVDHGEVPKPPAKKDKRLVAVDPGIATALGLAITRAEPASIVVEVRASGVVGFNEPKLARLAARVSGSVREVLKKVGDTVAAGEVLAVLDSREIAETKAAYLAAKEKLTLAQANVRRLEALFRVQGASEKDLLTARWEFSQTNIDLRAATQKLLSAGLGQDDIDRLGNGRSELSRFEIRAPFAGEILEKQLFVGELVPQDRQVFVMADLDHVWVNLKVGPEKLGDVTVGKTVRIIGNQGLTAEAKIDYIAPVVSDETRTVRVRVDLPNAEHKWRPGIVVDAVITTVSQPAAVTVPNEALQTVDGRLSVFLPVEDGFRQRPVKAGRFDAKRTEIVKGLAVGDKVATGQTFVLRAELEKGAGDDD
jgi:cobalt-zinc-cadmium efflux system membrane fusion protein